eukprot:gnl/Dysnectes_brevis/4121_a5425_1009.p1 GENE.gnl/Dysnectes_brevis/4121_a5425_1009~~gnl/Dysnectes_brevis/4121_a5425_1009.p1  ORF type:complete len:118 (-),score=6.32 gnl/Dysnectes_brevis/4121_a5425_1009:133-459(-)
MSSDYSEQPNIDKRSRRLEMMMEQKREHQIADLRAKTASLKRMTLDIHDEVNHHNVLLDDLTSDIHNASSNLDVVKAQVKKAIAVGKKHSCMMFIIIALIVIFLFILF